MARSALCQVEPSPSRGLGVLDTARLRIHRSRYVAYRDRIDRDRAVWPKPENAIAHVDSVLAEIEGILTRREAVAA